MADWKIVVWGDRFDRFVRKLDPEGQRVVKAALDFVLTRHGIAVCDSEWGKPLGGGLYEFRVRRPPVESGIQVSRREVLLRIFFTFSAGRVVILLSGYDKGREPSRTKQQREIQRARRLLEEFRAEGLRNMQLNA